MDNNILPAYAFWDIDRQNFDISKNKSFIISRLFERGTLDDVLKIIVFYGRKDVTNILKKNTYLNRQGTFLAHALLNIPLKDFNSYALLQHNRR